MLLSLETWAREREREWKTSRSPRTLNSLHSTLLLSLGRWAREREGETDRQTNKWTDRQTERNMKLFFFAHTALQLMFIYPAPTVVGWLIGYIQQIWKDAMKLVSVLYFPVLFQQVVVTVLTGVPGSEKQSLCKSLSQMGTDCIRWAGFLRSFESLEKFWSALSGIEKMEVFFPLFACFVCFFVAKKSNINIRNRLCCCTSIYWIHFNRSTQFSW